MGLILAIDQGTTSSRSVLFDQQLRPVASAQQEFTQHYPASGWVEHDPHDLIQTVLQTTKDALGKSGYTAGDISGIGITNQRETVILWDRATGEPLHRAIVWQDRRTADMCKRLIEDGCEPKVSEVTGLLLDPYFSATKLAWLLDNIDGARARAEAGELAFGTVDTWLIWVLTGGGAHVTDATNAARTMLYDIHQGKWSPEMLDLFNIPEQLLPDVFDSSAEFGMTDPSHFGVSLPILGVAGDQHAATIGQACFKPGMLKSTYGTGCFAMLNTGDTAVVSKNRLLTTIAYQLDGTPTYALEGSIFIAGAAVQWLRDELGLITSAEETQKLAENADPTQSVILVPAFTGLGAPYWDANCRGAVFGLTRNSGPAEFAQAALACNGYQTRDLWDAMRQDWKGEGFSTSATLRVDGGLSASGWAMQFLADMTNVPVERPSDLETTIKGAAWLAGNFAQIYPSQQRLSDSWVAEKTFQPNMPDERRDQMHAKWRRAVAAARQV